MPICKSDETSISLHRPPRKKCDTDGCNNVSVRGGKCKSHGAITKRCDVEGCSKVAAFNGMCERHNDLTDASPAGSSSDAPSAFEPAATKSQFVFAPQMLAPGAGAGLRSAFAPPGYPLMMQSGGFGSAFAGVMGFGGAYPYAGQEQSHEVEQEGSESEEPKSERREQQW